MNRRSERRRENRRSNRRDRSESPISSNARAETPERTNDRKTTVVCALAVFAASLLLFLPTVLFGFVNLDDPVYVYGNDAVVSPGGLRDIWSTFEMPENATNWPLVFTTFWIEYRIAGANPALYHLTNAVLHAMAAVLAFWMLLELGADRRTAFVAAMLFGIHPIQVESVAWITERKNVLSAAFFFPAMATYFRHRRTGAPRLYWLAVCFFALSLMSKSTAVGVPLLWILADRYVFDGKWSAASLKRAVAPAGLAAFSAWTALGADVVSSRTLPYLERPFIVAANFWFYLSKLFYPAEFVPTYPRWQVDVSEPAWSIPLAAAVLLALAVFRYRRRIDPISLWGGCAFFLLFLPVSGIQPFGYTTYTFAADRFAYLPSIGVFMIVGRALRTLDAPRFSRLRPAIAIAIAMAMASLSFKTLGQLPVWMSSQTLWDYAEEMSPAAAHDLQATGAFRNGRYRDAAEHLREVVKHRPEDVYALTSLGQCLFRSGERDRGLELMRQAVDIAPDDYDSLFNLGKAHVALRQFSQARTYLERADAASPNRLKTVLELAFVNLRLGRLSAAEADFDRVLRFVPRSAHACLGKAETLLARGRTDEGRALLETLTRESPAYAEGWRQLARLHWRNGAAERALDVIGRGATFADDPVPLRWLEAEILATDESVADPSRAADIAQTLVEENPQSLTAAQWETLARVYAAQKRWREAVEAIDKAVPLAEETYRVELENRRREYARKLETADD